MHLRWLLTLMLVLVPALSHAAIAFVSVTDSPANTTSASTLTQSVVVPSGSDRIMVVAVQEESGDASDHPVSGITFNATEALTFGCRRMRFDTPIRLYVELWYRVAPTVATADVVVTWSGTGNTRAQGFSVVLLTGVSQASPLDVCNTGADGSSTTASTSITTVADNAWIVDSALTKQNAGFTVGAGQTARTDRILNSGGFLEGAGVSTVNGKTPAGAETMDWTLSPGDVWASVAAAFVPSGGANPPPSAPTQATLRWTNGTDNVGITGTNVQRCTGAGCTPITVLTTVGPGLTTYVDQSLSANNTYCYQVNHRDGAGNQSIDTPTVCITTGTTFRRTLATKSWTGLADGADIGTDFTAGYTGWTAAKLVSGRVVPTTLNQDAIEQYNAQSPSNDQWCQVTIGAVGGAVAAEQGCNIGMPDAPTNNWYTAYAARNAGAFTTEIVDFDGSASTLASENTTTWAAGDKMRFQREGTTCKVYRVVGTVETLLINTTCSGHANGKVGIATEVATGGVLTDNQIFDFAMGDFTATAPTEPTITASTVDATGATLTHGPTTSTQIRVNVFSTTQTLSNVIEPISAFPAGRYTKTWPAGAEGVCFHPINALGIENTLTSAYQCDTLIGIVQPVDTTPPVLSGCRPTASLPFGTTEWQFSCVIDKPALCAYDTTDIPYASMANAMTTQALECAATKTGLTNGSTTTLYVRGQSIDALSEVHPTTTSQVVTLTVLGSAGADTTAPSTVTNLVATAISNSQVLLDWPDATDNVAVAGYQVYQAIGDCSTYSTAGDPVGASLAPQALTPDTVHCWKVRAIDTSNNLSAADSNIVTITTTGIIDVEPPSTMIGLTAVPFVNSILWQWGAGTDDKGTVTASLEQCEGVGCTTFELFRSAIAVQFLSRTNLTPGTVYCGRGKFSDDSGNVSIAYSETVCTTTLTSGLPVPRTDVSFDTPRLPTGTRLPAGARLPRP